MGSSFRQTITLISYQYMACEDKNHNRLLTSTFEGYFPPLNKVLVKATGAAHCQTANRHPPGMSQSLKI